MQSWDRLEGCKLSVTTLRNALAALPTGSSAYDEAYLDAMERIERQYPDHRVLAKDVLAWLTFAKRPLQVAELQAAVVVQETDSNLDEESLIDIEDMVSVCAGLVTVDERSQTVSLIHYTIQEYLERTRVNWHPDANAAITTSYLTYLLFSVFDVEFLKVDEDSPGERANRQLHPLLDYSKEYSALHARLALSEPPSIAQFFSSESKMPRNWLLLAAKHGGAQAEATAEWLIERGVCINVWDADRRTPLHYAVLNVWKRCVQLLLQRGASLDPDVDNITPFHYTVKNDADEIAQAFLDAGTPVDMLVTRDIYIPGYQQGRVVYVMRDGAQYPVREARTEKGLTALHLATLTGSQQMTKFLLDHGANPNFPSGHDKTPLHLALRRDLYGPEWPGIVDFWNDPMFRIEVALDFVELPDSEDEYCSTQDWIYKARSTIISLLLEHNKVDVNAQDIFGISSLHITARSGESSESIIRKLNDKGAKISVRTKKDETPLHLATRNRNLDAITALLTLGADPMGSDVNRLNALHYAAQNGHLGMMQSAVDHMPDASLETFLASKDNHRENVLHHLQQRQGWHYCCRVSPETVSWHQ
ncbi:ankyrin repeat-containing domain protein [Ilyonectria robusta]|uniref:ankyrin repeat-containing domain protein n=1 Tax=Ilyonectria robusta TaxID=1079257 RepID=UPI001E8D6F50|nr:ankyrin repeat-containing domain protein [Ilyonectria robusta]KAH8729175.1 ankyrin repeat-containing domain protein [Ilyonectria robusta]